MGVIDRGERSGWVETALGPLRVVWTARGVVAAGWDPDPIDVTADGRCPWAEQLARMARGDRSAPVPVDVSGTVFQRRVWASLCAIPSGETRSYTALAEEIGLTHGARAVATACASNPVALAIPCHRVVGSDGALRGYRWGLARKAALLRSEGVRWVGAPTLFPFAEA
jgi:AraC family transcriptional regulator of adaptative response/methylated-DNA-[protein]-cysteine methyltransferase